MTLKAHLYRIAYKWHWFFNNVLTTKQRWAVFRYLFSIPGSGFYQLKPIGPVELASIDTPIRLVIGGENETEKPY